MLFVSMDTLTPLGDTLDSIDGIELRLDLFPHIDFPLIGHFIKTSPKPVLLTLRKKSQGGKFEGDEKERETLILKLLELHPAFFDLECDMEEEFLQKTLQSYPLTKFILSHHEYRKTLDDTQLEKVYSIMKTYQAFGYKIAVLVSSTIDALRMLLFSKDKLHLSIICIGEKGSFARILGPVVGNLIDYAALNESHKTAPGQLTAHELISIYRYHELTSQTVLYGLIGDPVNKSLGHLYHNKIFKEKNLNAVYVKMTVTPEEIASFLPLATKLGFRGLSVTMPLKEIVYPLTQPIDSKVKTIQAINTLLITKEKILSTNTDGKGALDAIEKKVLVKDKILILIGAGGAAKAIAYEAKSRGAQIWILNRTLQRAIDLALDVGCGFLRSAPKEYDIVINCSPDPGEFDYSYIKSSTLVMDVVYNPRETLFLQRALELGAQVIYGEEMFLNQAQAQTNFWI
jgi:3-dehydroquinate dehydratase/shikimate dehydrogenase